VFSEDTKSGMGAVKGWQDSVDLTPEEAVTRLVDYCATFLCKRVDTVDSMQRFSLDVVRRTG
jgi:phosphoribosylformimino-5-aminoimidazole carboxamide ribotide isomerase